MCVVLCVMRGGFEGLALGLIWFGSREVMWVATVA